MELTNVRSIQAVVDFLNDAVIGCDANGIINIFNTTAAIWTKISPERAVGHKVDVMLPQAGLADILTKKEKKLSQPLMFNGKSVICSRFPLLNDKDEVLGAIGIFKEVDDLNGKSGIKLTDQLEKIIDSSYDGIWITDGEGFVLYTNSANERISGYTREEAVGRHTRELLEQGMFSESVTLHVLEKKEPVTITTFNYRTKKHVLVTGNPIFDENGKIIYVVNNIRDITKLNQLKLELEAKAKELDRQQSELAHLRFQQLKSFHGAVANSLKMIQVFDLAIKVGEVDCTVLVLGESGSGKEVVARTIVQASNRKNGPFVKINCGAIPEHLLESELFGYEKGAFTGADKKGKIGLLEMAQKGTLFLDEVAELPLNLQVKLLRVLQEQEITRIGGLHPIKLDVRIIAATNRKIETMVEEGKFRLDLFYRLNIVTVEIPPLRERQEDIPSLVNEFLQRFNKKYGAERFITQDALDLFMAYHWPGNVRELENLIENLVILNPEKEISALSLPSRFRQGDNIQTSQLDIRGIIPLKDATNKLEKELIKNALDKFSTTRKAAEALGVDQSTIVRKMQKLNIKFNE